MSEKTPLKASNVIAGIIIALIMLGLAGAVLVVMAAQLSYIH